MAPFPPEAALNQARLHIGQTKNGPSPLDTAISQPLHHLPGEPCVSLSPDDVRSFLKLELDTLVLDELHPRLFLSARRQGCHIDALSQHRSRGRKIIATEDIHLHLVWGYDYVFVKRIPESLLNHDVWTMFLSPNSSANNAYGGANPTALDPKIALGFLRSYAFLVRHQLDFILAQESYLLPSTIEWTSWASFIANFRDLQDTEVAKRYEYGQLRMTRLNWAVRIFSPPSSSTRWFYHIPQWSMLGYLESATIPLLFAFATLSLVLSAMQVALSINMDSLGIPGSDDLAIGKAFWVFSLIVIISSATTWVLMLAIPFFMLVWQLKWGYQHRRPGASTSLST
ncbi:hypothetical protein DER46DRAFT_611600 [Fusarium sp. MPI-SDFR-AT-0072]|nr:hypothetical protein DER46DRAFT_611600 [Fusarium sp. MPI-SDFR-AT-0072]